MRHVEVKNIEFSYDGEINAVSDVSFSVEKGTYTTIIGHNGSGKSTIAKLLIGLLEKSRGEIRIDDLELSIENLYQIRSKVGIVFQNPDNQFIGATVRDDIAFGLENHCVNQNEMEEIIHKFASLVHMENYLDHEPTKLSGGQKQRVAIAGVLAMNPDILIFDESTSMLDPQGKEEINQVIHELFEQSKMTMISITHDMEEVAKSDYVIVMDKGQVVMEGHPSEVLANEEKLIDLQLDVPFSVKLRNRLKDKGIELKENTSIERMVDELCQYKSII